MNVYVILAAALLPPLLLWIYIWRKDPQPEPMRLLLKAFFFGAFICIPVAFLEAAIVNGVFGGEPTSLSGATLQAFLVAALPEESFKLLVLWLVLRHNPFFDEHFDGIVYAVCVGLGFAAFENVGYLFIEPKEWVSVAVSRALLAVPGHYAFAVLMGYYYSIYHFVDHTPRTAALVLLAPVLAHGIYDAIAFAGGIEPAFSAILMLLLVLFCIHVHKLARRKIMALIDRDAHNGIHRA